MVDNAPLHERVKRPQGGGRRVRDGTLGRIGQVRVFESDRVVAVDALRLQPQHAVAQELLGTFQRPIGGGVRNGGLPADELRLGEIADHNARAERAKLQASGAVFMAALDQK